MQAFELVLRLWATTTSALRASVQSLVNRHIDEEYTSSQRRRHAGHGSDSVYDQYYAPTNPDTDGQAAYTGDTPRTLPSKLVRLRKMDHNPELAQTLPARELHELVTSDKYSAVFADLESLPDSDDATTKKERAEILGRLRGLKLAALKAYHENQKENPQLSAKAAKSKDVGHHRIPFSRIRHLMPVRQRLSESLFTVAAIRSKAGKAVLQDLIELYRSEFELEARPGLELKNCHCAAPKSVPAHVQWKHIYSCHKSYLASKRSGRSPASFAEFCFLCPEGHRSTSQDDWKRHCESHLANLDTLPYQCDPLIYANTLARIPSALNHSRSPKTGTSIFMTFTAGSLGNRRQVLRTVVPKEEEVVEQNSILRLLGTSSRSPEPTLNAHAVDHNSLDLEFVAALEQTELVPEEDAQPATREFEAQAVQMNPLRCWG
ncbi:hypothetical protein EUX98_g6434 [Antrodiella citrinella]|uniref:C2H2-type domain-containing protein n=1 Tax=Antrodiella citrinella TaxID=2447956 RepID=A0A4S4MR49_9APHY|nr:hypothetical protein EUX98_g6434 [Antrodiella citrinella]